MKDFLWPSLGTGMALISALYFLAAADSRPPVGAAPEQSPHYREGARPAADPKPARAEAQGRRV